MADAPTTPASSTPSTSTPPTPAPTAPASTKSSKTANTAAIVFVVVGSVLAVLVVRSEILKQRSVDEDIAEAKRQAATAPAPPKDIQHYAVSAILADYEANEVSADMKYKSKWVELTGSIGGINKSAFGQVYVMLGTGGKLEFHTAHCYLADTEIEKASKLSKGMTVTIRGVVDGLLLGNVVMRSASIE